MIVFNDMIITEGMWQNMKNTASNAYETATSLGPAIASLGGTVLMGLGGVTGMSGLSALGSTMSATGLALSVPQRAKNLAATAKNDFQNRQMQDQQKTNQAPIQPQQPQQNLPQQNSQPPKLL